LYGSLSFGTQKRYKGCIGATINVIGWGGSDFITEIEKGNRTCGQAWRL